MHRRAPVHFIFAASAALLVSCGGERSLAPSLTATDAGIALASAPSMAPPSNVSATANSDSRIDVRWQETSTSETGFEVHRSLTGSAGPFALLVKTGANAIAYDDLGLQPGKEYCYSVRALRTVGNKTVYSAFANVACAITTSTAPPPPPPPPPPPVSGYIVGVKPLSSSMLRVSVQWTDVSTVPSYRMYRSTDGGSVWDLVTLTGGSDGVFLDYNRPSEQATCYRVVAYNAGGDAPPSNTACATPPATPTDLDAVIVDAQTLALTWTDNSGVEAGYQLWVRYYRPAMGCYSDAEGGTDTGTIEGDYLVADLPANSTTFRATQVSDVSACFPRFSYWFYVVATRDGGKSDPSNEVSASIDASASSSTQPLLLSAKAQAIPGSYELSFFFSGPELILKAHVADAISGAPAQSGTATFQYCSLKGGRTLQMRPLPSVECESGGSGTWVRLARIGVNTTGDAFLDFGIAPRIATVGFRFLYSGERGGIASGVSAPLDFVP